MKNKGGMRLRKCRYVCYVCIVAVVFIIAVTIPLARSYYTGKTYTATVTDKDIKNYNSSKYLVFTKLDNGETRTFCIEDTIITFRWNSSDFYAEVEVGKTYEFTVIGWRIPFLSSYENIIKMEVANPD